MILEVNYNLSNNFYVIQEKTNSITTLIHQNKIKVGNFLNNNLDALIYRIYQEYNLCGFYV